jgi:hypothetical protein
MDLFSKMKFIIELMLIIFRFPQTILDPSVIIIIVVVMIIIKFHQFFMVFFALSIRSKLFFDNIIIRSRIIIFNFKQLFIIGIKIYLS